MPIPGPDIQAEFTPHQDLAMVGGAFDGAARTKNTLMTWNPPLRSADMDLVPEKMKLDARVRDSVRNDAYIRSGMLIHQDSVVGALFALNAKPFGTVLGAGFDDTWEEEFQQEVEERFTLWAESPDMWVDAARKKTLTDMVRLAVGVHTAGGEVLATVERLRGFGRPFRTAIQFVEADRLSTPPNRSNDRRVVAGIERDRFGAPLTAFIRTAHPADWRYPGRHEWKAIPFRKPWGRLQVIHLHEQFRPDQTRGVAEMVTALEEIRQTKKWRDVSLQNAVVSATYAAAIESDLPSADAFATIGGVDDIPGAMQQYVEGYLGQIAAYSGGAKNLQLDGVKIPHLFPGTKLNIMSPGKGGPMGQDFEKSLLRYIASAVGVSYEQLSRDYSSTNYSSARAAMAETWKRMTVIKRQVADRMATIVYRLWLEEAIGTGQITALPAAARRDGWLYEGQNFDALSACDWIGASRGQIDELKETQAAVLRLRYNLSTQEDEAARFGKDWRRINRQRKREVEQQREMGISPEESDNMMNAASGDVREDQTQGEPSEAGTDDT